MYKLWAQKVVEQNWIISEAILQNLLFLKRVRSIFCYFCVTMNSGNIMIDRLEGESNWVVWKFQVRIHLQAHGLMPVVDGTKVEDSDTIAANTKLEYLVQSVIVSTLSPEVRKLITMCNTAYDMWQKLHGIFEQRTEQKTRQAF